MYKYIYIYISQWDYLAEDIMRGWRARRGSMAPTIGGAGGSPEEERHEFLLRVTAPGNLRVRRFTFARGGSSPAYPQIVFPTDDYPPFPTFSFDPPRHPSSRSLRRTIYSRLGLVLSSTRRFAVEIPPVSGIIRHDKYAYRGDSFESRVRCKFD